MKYAWTGFLPAPLIHILSVALLSTLSLLSVSVLTVWKSYLPGGGGRKEKKKAKRGVKMMWTWFLFRFLGDIELPENAKRLAMILNAFLTRIDLQTGSGSYKNPIKKWCQVISQTEKHHLDGICHLDGYFLDAAPPPALKCNIMTSFCCFYLLNIRIITLNIILISRALDKKQRWTRSSAWGKSKSSTEKDIMPHALHHLNYPSSFIGHHSQEVWPCESNNNDINKRNLIERQS